MIQFALDSLLFREEFAVVGIGLHEPKKVVVKRRTEPSIAIITHHACA